MAYFELDGAILFGACVGADETAEAMGARRMKEAPDVRGVTWTEISFGLSRADVPPLASLADAYGGSGFADEY